MRRLVLAGLVLAGLIAPALAQEASWVAIASDGRDLFGLAVGMGSRGAAEGAAIGQCGTPCEVKLAGIARCAAIARSDSGDASGYAAGADLEGVRQLAWADCNRRVPSNSCRIRAAQCFP